MTLTHSMKHRHLDTQEFTSAAIEDIVLRGKKKDWIELRDAINQDEEIRNELIYLCQENKEENSMRYNFWINYILHKWEQITI